MFFIFFDNCGDAFGKVVSDGMTIALLQRLMFYIHHYCLMYYGCVSSKHIFTHNSILSYPRITSAINCNTLQSSVDLGNLNGGSYTIKSSIPVISMPKSFVRMSESPFQVISHSHSLQHCCFQVYHD